MCRPPNISEAKLIALRPRSQPGTQCHTARRLYVSRIANFRVSYPRYGAANKDVSCRHCAKDGAFGGNPVPQKRAYTVSLLCVVGAERGVTLVPLFKCGSDKLSEERMRPVRARFKFRMELGGHKPWMIWIFNNFYQTTIQ